MKLLDPHPAPVAPGDAVDRSAHDGPLLPVAILGGGLTGLTAAWQLRQQGVPVRLFEARDQVGGVVDSVREGDWLRETGPNTLFENSPEITALVDQLGLESRRLVASPAAGKRYVVLDGHPMALPASPMEFLATPLLSWRAKLRALGEPFRPRRGDGLEENVAQFVTRRLGPEFLDYIVNPFVAGVYAGDPAALSLRHAFPKLHALERDHGSLLRGSLKLRNASAGPRGHMVSFPNGLAEITRTMAEWLGSAVHLRETVRFVRRTGSTWRVGTAVDGQPLEGEFSAVICALPPDALAHLHFDRVPGADRLDGLRRIPQPPVASVFLGFRREDVAHPLDGFGLLTPAVEKRRILGTLFSSALFPGRAPAGHVALTTFVGGSRQPELAGRDDGALADLVRSELTELLGARGAPVFTRVQRWPRAIVQYPVGFQQYKDACTLVEDASPGLFLGGTCRDGVSLANCLAAGRRLARAAGQRVGVHF